MIPAASRSMLVWHVSSFSPTLCGIANYSEALVAELGQAQTLKCGLLYSPEYANPANDVSIYIDDLSSHLAAASAINASNADVVSLQHEFGIFGGDDGDYVIPFIETITKPVVTTLHTTPKQPGLKKSRILQTLLNNSAATVVLTEKAKQNLLRNFEVHSERIYVIRHGIPPVDFSFPEDSPLRTKLSKSLVFVSVGFMKPIKGYEQTIAAFARLANMDRDVMYVIVGSEQPQFARCHGYVQKLKSLIAELGLEDNIFLVGTGVSQDELIEYVTASDLGVVNYADQSQCSSGVIPLILGCGRPVISTPIEYAQETATCVPGIRLMDIRDPDYLLRAMVDAWNRRHELRRVMPQIHEQTRPWVWNKAARNYQRVFLNASI